MNVRPGVRVALAMGGDSGHAKRSRRLRCTDNRPGKIAAMSTPVGPTVGATRCGWLHDETAELRGFSWQNGYGAIAVSYSNLDSVKAYLANQEEHHRTGSFQDEFRALLGRHGIEWDERYVWD